MVIDNTSFFRMDPDVPLVVPEVNPGAHPLAVSTLDAAGCGASCCASWLASGRPRHDAAWNDALHLLGVLERGQSLAQLERRELTGQVAGSTCPRSGRLYVLGGWRLAALGDRAQVTHALQDEHFHLTRGAFAPRPGDHDGELGAQALVEGDATDIQSRYVSSSRRATSSSELARTLGRSRRTRRPVARSAVFCATSCSIPTRRVWSSCARCERGAVSACWTGPSVTRRGRRPRYWILRAIWPGIRRRRGEPPGGRYVLVTTFGPRT